MYANYYPHFKYKSNASEDKLLCQFLNSSLNPLDGTFRGLIVFFVSP